MDDDAPLDIAFHGQRSDQVKFRISASRERGRCPRLISVAHTVHPARNHVGSKTLVGHSPPVLSHAFAHHLLGSRTRKPPSTSATSMSG